MVGKRPGPRSVSRLLSDRGGAAPHETGEAGGLLQFFARLAEAAQALSEAGSETLQHEGEWPFSLGGKQGRAVFGYTLRRGLDGVRAEPFGDAPPMGGADKPAPSGATAAPRTPIVDVFEEDDDIRVVAELPGVAAADIVCTLDGTALNIATCGAVQYRKTIDLPQQVDFSSLRQSCLNGILEVRLRRASAP
jgi:HSP20 family protein